LGKKTTIVDKRKWSGSNGSKNEGGRKGIPGRGGIVEEGVLWIKRKLCCDERLMVGAAEAEGTEKSARGEGKTLSWGRMGSQFLGA